MEVGYSVVHNCTAVYSAQFSRTITFHLKGQDDGENGQIKG